MSQTRTRNICKKYFLSFRLKDPLTRETDTIKSWATFQNFSSWVLRFTKMPFGTWQFGNICVFAKFSILKLKFCKIAQLLIVSVSLMRDFLREREKYFPHILGLKEEKNFFETKCFSVSFFYQQVYLAMDLLWQYCGDLHICKNFLQNVLFFQIYYKRWKDVYKK